MNRAAFETSCYSPSTYLKIEGTYMQENTV